MRVFIFLFCLSAFSITPEKGFGQTATVVIDANKKVSADEVFDLIMNQTDYKFIYQEGIFKNLPKIALSKGTISTKNLLERTLSVGNFDFEYNSNKTIIIKTKAVKKVIVQNREISGTIKDKLKFCRLILTLMDHVEWTLTDSAKELCKTIFEHIDESNNAKL